MRIAIETPLTCITRIASADGILDKGRKDVRLEAPALAIFRGTSATPLAAQTLAISPMT